MVSRSGVRVRKKTQFVAQDLMQSRPPERSSEVGVKIDACRAWFQSTRRGEFPREGDLGLVSDS